MAAKKTARKSASSVKRASKSSSNQSASASKSGAKPAAKRKGKSSSASRPAKSKVVKPVAKKTATKKSSSAKGNTKRNVKATKAKPATKKTVKAKPAARKASAKLKSPAAKSAPRKTSAKSPTASKKVEKKSKAVAEKVSKTTKGKASKPRRSSASGATKPTAKKAAKTSDSGSSSAVVVRSADRTKKSRGKKAVQSPFSTADHDSVYRGIQARKAAAKANRLKQANGVEHSKRRAARKLTDKQLKQFEEMLMRIREELSRQIAYLRGASLTRADEVNPEEDGTDAFERQLALKLAAGEGDSIFEIDEALERIRNKTYGVCQDCGCVIHTGRLKALPFARRCVECKELAEKKYGTSEHRYF